MVVNLKLSLSLSTKFVEPEMQGGKTFQLFSLKWCLSRLIIYFKNVANNDDKALPLPDVKV